MQYYHSFEVDLKLLPQGYQPVWGQMFPILLGDESEVYEIGDPVWIGDLVPRLEVGDIIIGSREFSDWVCAEYPSLSWEIRPGYWSLEVCMELLDDDY